MEPKGVYQEGGPPINDFDIQRPIILVSLHKALKIHTTAQEAKCDTRLLEEMTRLGSNVTWVLMQGSSSDISSGRVSSISMNVSRLIVEGK
jgi:hypothetical protein